MTDGGGYWIVNAAKGAKSLQDVRNNVERLGAKAKGNTKETYELIGEYLDLVLPEMRELNASDVLDLQPGLNVMDLAGAGQQLQAMVIRACLERINLQESGVLTVFPEAWEFAPRGRVSPASAEAVAMARKGAVLGNFLLCDSQDIAGVDTVVRQAASVWILGVQRELNELKRTLAMIPASIKKPKLDEITSLELGQFIACWGRHAVRTYIQPAWMNEADAIAIARGAKSIDQAARRPPSPPAMMATSPAAKSQPKPELENQMNATQEGKLDQVLEFIKRGAAAQAAVNGTPAASPPKAMPADEEGLFQRLKERLLRELPLSGSGPIQVIAPQKLRKDFQRDEADRVVKAARALKPLQKKILKLVETTSDYTGQKTLAERLGRATAGGSWVDLTTAVKELAAEGFVEVKEKQGVRKKLREKIAADLAFYEATDAEVDAVHQSVLFELATEQPT